MSRAIANRRQLLRSAVTSGALVLPAAAVAKPKHKPDADEGVEVTPTEDLMREHGVLERVLLVYDEVARRIGKGDKPPLDAVAATARIVQRFFEQYHEKLEEEHVFPRLEKASRLADVTKTLREQHAAGRAVTARVLQATKGAATATLAADLSAFARMFRPHAAREDTVVFPAFHALFDERAFHELGERFEEQEHKLLGSAGFEGTVEEIAQIERTLGLFDLAAFTAR